MTFVPSGSASSRRAPYNAIFDQFNDGVNTLLEEARIGPKMAKTATNLIQTQDGLWTTRWGTAYYGSATPNSKIPDGAAEYVKSDGTTELIVVAVNVYKSTDGGSWSTISGATFTEGVKCFFCQINERLYITNGTDSLAFYDGTDLTKYTQISAPAWGGTPLARGAGLSAGSYTYYYRITALNEVGSTEGNAEQSITVNKLRDSWVASSNEYLTLTWVAVVGATRYQIFMSDEAGYEVLLDTVTGTTYQDNSSATPNPYIELPNDNTTSAPKFRQMELSGNRIWATDDPDNKYRVYYSGVGQYLGNFSDFYGGGWIDLEPGGRDTPKSVVHYRTGKGDSIVTAICSSPEGKGTIWQIELSSVTIEETSFTIPAANKVIGSIGTNAPLSVVKAGNNIYFFNKKGFTTLGSRPNLLNILASDEISTNIRPSVRSFVASKISDVCGYFYEGKIFWSVPESASGNDKMYIFDTERRNWQISWSIGAKQFIEYTDTSGVSHFLYVPTSGSQLIEISESITGDLGQAFTTQYISGLYPIDKDKTKWAKIKYAYIELGRPKGSVTFSLLGTEKKRGFSTLGTTTITDSTSATGYSFDKYSCNKYSDTAGVPDVYSSSSLRRRIRINKLLNNYQFNVSSSSVNDYYSLLSLQVKGAIVPTRDPASWSA